MAKKTLASKDKGKGKVEKVMHEFKHGELKSGKGGKGGAVESRKQAVAIALNEARQVRRAYSKKKKA